MMTRPSPRRRAATLAVALLPLLAAGCAAGRGTRPPLVAPDRPGYSYGTATAPAGVVQLEAGFTDARAADQTYRTLGEGLLRVGAGSRTELRVSTNSYAIRSAAAARAGGFEDAKLGVKQRLVAGSGRADVTGTSVALLGGLTMPTGTPTFGGGAWQPELLAATTVPLTSRTSVTGNLGYTYAVAGEARAHRTAATLAGWYALSGRVSAFAEWAGSQVGAQAATRQHFLDAGVTVVPVANLQLDARVGRGANGLPDDHFFGLGVTRRW